MYGVYITRGHCFSFQEPPKQTNDIEVTISEEIDPDSTNTNVADFLRAVSTDDVTTVRRMIASKIFDSNHRFEVSLLNVLCYYCAFYLKLQVMCGVFSLRTTGLLSTSAAGTGTCRRRRSSSKPAVTSTRWAQAGRRRSVWPVRTDTKKSSSCFSAQTVTSTLERTSAADMTSLLCISPRSKVTWLWSDSCWLRVRRSTPPWWRHRA